MRIERHVRYDAGARPRLRDILVPDLLGDLWREPLDELLRATTTTERAMRRLLEACRAEALDVPAARRLAGYLALRAAAPDIRSSASTEGRAIAHLTALGIEHVNDDPAARSLELLRAAAARWNLLRPATRITTCWRSRPTRTRI